MSYDGGLSVKIANDVMLGILQKYKDNGAFEESTAIQNMIGHKYRKQSTRLTLALYWHYMDAAEISTCPKTLEQVLDAAIELLDHFADDDGIEYDQAYKDCIRELKDNRDAINSSYEFVEWEYFPSDYEHAAEGRDEETFEWKEGIENYTGNPAPEPASVEFDRDAVGKLNADLWLEDYGTYLEQDPVIDFNGTRFVFTGLTGTENEKDNPVVQKLTLKGGQHRKNVSGKTDYLVVAPEWAGASKIEAVLEQRKNGKSIKVILLEDLKKALDEPDAADTAASEKNETYNAEEKTEKTSATKAEFDKNFKYRVREEDMYFLGRTYPKGIIIDEYIGDSCMVVVPEEVDGMKVVLISGLGDCPNVTKVEIPDSVDYSDDAFDGCPKLADKDGILVIKGRLLSFRINSACVEIPADKGIKYISGRPFQKNEQITEIVLPNGLLEVEHSAFRDCKNLKTVRFPDSLKEIGVAAFENCAALERLSFPDGLVKIGMAAFEGCKSLSSVTIDPNTECEERAFSTGNYSNLAREDGYTVINGVMYDVDYRIFKGNKEFVVDIPHDVTAIAGSIIFNSPGATIDRFTITDQVRLINADDFFVSSIERFRIIDHDDGHTLFETDYFNGNRDDADNLLASSEDFGTFCELIEEQDYDKLSELFGPDDPSMYSAISTKSELKDAKPTKPEMKSTPAKEDKETAEVTDVSETDFSNDPEILAYLDRGFVVLTPSTSDVETSDDRIITKYKGDANKVVITGDFHGIGEYAFSNNKGIEEVAILSGVKTIGEAAFFSCENLISVTMHEGVEIIDDSAFLDCIKLTSVSLPDTLKELKQDAFCGCSSLEQIKLPQSLTSIGDWAFSVCTELKEISIPDSVRYIGSSSFNMCKKLKYLYIPPTVEELGDGWLDDLSEFWAIIHVEKGSPAERDLLKCSDVEKYTIVYEKPNESEIEAHYNNPYGVSGTEFIIRDEVLIGVETADEKIEIPATVKKISKEAFRKCGRVKEIILPEGVVEIESGAFSEAKRLQTVSLPNTLKTLCTFTALEELKEISIPDGITEIPDSAFWLCKKLKKIVLPRSLRVIGERAFEKTAVEEIVIPDSVVTIGRSAFEECRYLKNVVMSTQVREIGECAFSKTAIKSIFLPDTVTAIGDSAFKECEYIERIIIPDSVNKMEEYVFSGCINLREVTLPCTLKRIPDNLFSGCRQLSSITLGSSIKTIGKWAFSDCKSLSSISIPKSVTEISQGAFSNCSSLIKVFIPDSVVKIGEYAFSGCEGITDIYIPSSVTGFGEFSLNFYPAEPRVHIIKGSAAEKACEDDFVTNVVYETEASMISVEKAEYKSDSDAEAQTYAQRQTTAKNPSVNAEESSGLTDVMSDLSVQIAEMQNQEASPASSSSYNRSGAPSYSKPATVPTASYPDTNSAPLASDSRSGKDARGNTNKEHDADGQKSEVNYVIHYDLNGGNGRFPNQKKKAEETIIIHKDIPTHKDGMIFECWISDDKRLKGNRFYPGDSYCYDFSTTLKAFWKREGDELFYYDNAYHSIPEPATHKELPQQKKKEGCYLATAVYGSYDAPQVMALRRYRDETLQNTAFGRWFIRTYYRLSPPIAEKLKNAKRINHFVRSILDKWVERLNKKQM